MVSDIKSGSTGKIWAGPEINDLEAKVRLWKSLGHYLLDKLEENSQQVIYTDFASGRQWTGAQFREKVMAVACALVDEYNFQAGTMVCFSYDNSDYLVILTVAVLIAGGSFASCYHKDPYAELLYMARKVEPKFLFCHAKKLDWAAQLKRDLGFHVEGISMDPSSVDDNVKSFHHLLNYDYVKCSRAFAEKLLPVACVRDLTQEVALVSMSSGTTGKPKAVSQSHYNCLADLVSVEAFKGSNKFSIACCASLDYVSGRLILFGAIHRGYNAVILKDFEPESYLRALEQHKVVVIYLGAASFYNLITHPDIDKYYLSSLRSVFPMGAKITYQKELAEFFSKHPNIVEVRQGYGASEFGGAAMNFMKPDVYLSDANNCGKLFKGMKAKILDCSSGQLLGANQQGMLHIKGPTLFPGYYDKEQARLNRKARKVATAQNGTNNNNVHDDQDDDDKQLDESPFVWDASVFDADGFYVTGDLAYFDDSEQLFIVGRQKELMSCRGAKKVLPQELEEIVQEHPAVMKVCVLGVPNKRELTLQCPRAFVVAKPEYYNETLRDSLKLRPKFQVLNGELEDALRQEKLEHVGKHTLNRMSSEWRHALAEDLMAFANERVGWEKHLTGGIVLLDDIPTSRATGKMDKNYLRSLTLDQVEVFGDRSS